MTAKNEKYETISHACLYLEITSVPMSVPSCEHAWRVPWATQSQLCTCALDPSPCAFKDSDTAITLLYPALISASLMNYHPLSKTNYVLSLIYKSFLDSLPIPSFISFVISHSQHSFILKEWPITTSFPLFPSYSSVFLSHESTACALIKVTDDLQAVTSNGHFFVLIRYSHQHLIHCPFFYF